MEVMVIYMADNVYVNAKDMAYSSICSVSIL